MRQNIAAIRLTVRILITYVAFAFTNLINACLTESISAKAISLIITSTKNK